MSDIVDTATRSRMMSGIRSKNTGPEVAVRKALHAMGLRFRLHRKDLPGSPDIALPRHNVVIMVHGCFWHGHDCRLFKLPGTRQEFWKAKIEGNVARDRRNLRDLKRLGWRTIVVRECSLRGRKPSELSQFFLHLKDKILDSRCQE